jgi:hypothetical protein
VRQQSITYWTCGCDPQVVGAVLVVNKKEMGSNRDILFEDWFTQVGHVVHVLAIGQEDGWMGGWMDGWAEEVLVRSALMKRCSLCMPFLVSAIVIVWLYCRGGHGTVHSTHFMDGIDSACAVP